jgi:hypothetical protein
VRGAASHVHEHNHSHTLRGIKSCLLLTDTTYAQHDDDHD